MVNYANHKLDKLLPAFNVNFRYSLRHKPLLLNLVIILIDLENLLFPFKYVIVIYSIYIC